MMDESVDEQGSKIKCATSYCASVLSPRELEVLTLSAHGKTYAVIAHMLSISEDAVKDHLDRIRRKLNATNKTNSVAIAVSRGLIRL